MPAGRQARRVHWPLASRLLVDPRRNWLRFQGNRVKTPSAYRPELLFLLVAVAISIAGFWKVYFGKGADPNSYHHLHVVSNFFWLSLLVIQLYLVGSGDYKRHRTWGILVMVAAPLLVASTALLSVHSAHKGIASGKGDMLLVQNVTVTLELALLILFAFIFRRHRKLHGAFLLSTAILFLGIALFFTLISFIPGFKVEGPGTFHRFQTSAMAASIVCLVVGLLLFLRDVKNAWPLLVSGSLLIVNEIIRIGLDGKGLIAPLTAFVGSLNQTITFVVSLSVFASLLVATGLMRRGPRPA